MHLALPVISRVPRPGPAIGAQQSLEPVGHVVDRAVGKCVHVQAATGPEDTQGLPQGEGQLGRREMLHHVEQSDHVGTPIRQRQQACVGQ